MCATQALCKVNLIGTIDEINIKYDNSVNIIKIINIINIVKYPQNYIFK